VNGTIEGCYSYLHGDSTPGASLVTAANPEMSPALVSYAIKVMRDREMIDGGDASKLGIGAITDERFKAFFDTMTAAGIYPADLDYKRGYTLQFVNKRHGAPGN
jgi:NitT/TauT family transport system substrate-binding protein